jgi:hypothetical protein
MRTISLLFVAQIDYGEKGMSMNDWSDYASARLRQQDQDQQLKDKKFLEKQRLKRAHGTKLWHEVRRIVKENSEHLNIKEGKQILVFEVTQNTQLKVRANLKSESRPLQATFDEERGRLEWECREKSGDAWELFVTEDGGVSLCRGMVPTTPALVAKQMLDALLFD